MKSVLLSLLIGFAAAVVDTAPMIARKLDIMFILSAFSLWLLLGFLIPRVGISPHGWLNGLVTSVLVAIPVFCLAVRLDPKALPVMLLTTVVLGSAVGWVSGLLVR